MNERKKIIRGSELPKAQQEELTSILRFQVTQKLINDIMVNPPKIDLSKIKLVVSGDKKPEDIKVKDGVWSASGGCETCSAIGGGCETCSAIC